MSGWECAFYLESGQLFRGEGFGARVVSGGEAVFNTGMTGYQEIFTDPSYTRQIVVMSCPHIGNTGVNAEDNESKGLDLSGVVARNYCAVPSNWRSAESLGSYLSKAGVPGISGIDTREITRILRDEGAQRAVIFPTELAKGKDLKEHGKALLVEVPSMEGLELVSQVSCKAPYTFKDGGKTPAKEARPVVVYDFGVKRNIPRSFHERGFRVEIVPYNLPHQEVLSYDPVAVVLSNGPGDPAQVQGAVGEIQSLIGRVPIMAICMGHQLLARALGCVTYKLKFGHHGVNHPVKDLLLQKILITSQNHGFAVREEDLKAVKDVSLSHVSLNDHTVEGFASEKMRFTSVQFHPEAKPGPSDAAYLFEHFIKGFLQ